MDRGNRHGRLGLLAAHLENHEGDHCGPCDADDVVNTPDLIDLLLDFGTTGSGPSDINQDGTVNVLDLIELLLVFGTACP